MSRAHDVEDVRDWPRSEDDPAPRSEQALGTVLLVDDERAFRESTAELLRISGFACEAVDGPAAALAELDARRCDVLVTDLVMHGQPQLEFLRDIASRDDAPAIIVVTGYPSIESAIMAVDLRAMGYLRKPFEADELVRRVEDALEQRRMDAFVERTESSLREASAALENLVRLAESKTAAEPKAFVPLPKGVAEKVRSLTPREREILDELLQGYRLSTVARRLTISTHTVRRHLKNIFLKLQVNSQAELMEKLKP